jgi:hypothetical protein
VAFLTGLFGQARGQSLPPLPGPALADPEAYFFPDQSVCLVLSLDFLSKSGFWLAYAQGPEAAIAADPPNHVDALPRRGLLADPGAGTLRLPDAALVKGYDRVPTVFDLDRVAPTPDAVAALADPILFFSEEGPLVYIADIPAAKSLAFRLLAPTGFSSPRFRRLFYESETGGAWLVERD